MNHSIQATIPARLEVKRIPRPKHPRFTVANVSSQAPAAAMGMALSTYVFLPAVVPWMFPVCMAATAAAIYLGRHTIGPRLLFLGLLSIPLAWVLAIPLASTLGFGLPVASSIIAGWWALMALIYWASPTQAALIYVIPAWLLNASITIYQGLTIPGRSAAFTDSSNVSAGFLVMGVVYTLTTRLRWLALPMGAAVPFTGSRLASIALLIVLTGMLARHSAPRQLIVACVVVLAIVSFTFQSGVADNYRVESGITETIMEALEDIEVRILEGESKKAQPQYLGILPAGYMGAVGTHSVFLRMIFEIGVIQAAIFLWVTVWALWHRPRFDVTWWMLVAFMLLGLLDYYSWMPYTISAFWWVLVAMRVKSNEHSRS